jgi:hypothetical protein
VSTETSTKMQGPVGRSTLDSEAYQPKDRRVTSRSRSHGPYHGMFKSDIRLQHFLIDSHCIHVGISQVIFASAKCDSTGNLFDSQ